MTSEQGRITRNVGLAVAGGAALAGAALVARAGGRAAANAHYVALGSSFAAGLGLERRAPGSPLVSQRGLGGYPPRLARMLGVPSFTDVTSSGSTVRHVLRGGQFGLPAQVDALGPDTRLVTLTAGGNDVSYVGDLMRLAWRNRGGALGRAVALFWAGPAPLSDRPFPALEAEMAATVREIRRRSPRATVVLATYPTILPRTGTCAALGLDRDQAAAMRAVGDRLAAVTRAAAARTGAVLVDVAALSAWHHACSAEPWVNGARPDSGAAFHPNLAGARATAAAIAEALAAPGAAEGQIPRAPSAPGTKARP